MINRNSKISNIQLSALVITTIIGVGILSLPSVLAQELETGGWALIVVSSIIASLLTLFITLLCSYYPGETLSEFGRDLVTSPISDVISFIFWIYFIGLSAFELRLFAEVVKMFLLTQTPTEVIIISILLVTTYIARCGIEELARIALILFPISIIPIIALFFSLLPELDFTNLLPLFRFTLSDLVKGIPVTFFSFIGFEFLLFFIAYSDSPKNCIKSNLLSILIVTTVYLLTFFVTLAKFGSVELKHQLWPTLSLMKTIDIPGAFIENVEGVAMTIWVLIVFTSLGPLLFIASLILSKLLRGKEHNYFVLPLVPLAYFLSLVPDDLAQLYEFMDMFIYYIGSITTVLIPVLFFIIALLKKARRERSANIE